MFLRQAPKTVLGPTRQTTLLGGAAMRPKTLADVITIVVANCTDLSCPRDVCSLLLVDSNCRQKLQERDVTGHMCVDDLLTWWRFSDAVERALRLSSFVCWLPKHAGLVSSLTVSSLQDVVPGGCSHLWDHWRPPTDSEWLLVQQQLALALQLCRLAAAHRNTVSQPLHLHHCSIKGMLQEPRLLQELGAVGLPELCLWGNPPISGSILSSCMSALAKMTSLKSLSFALTAAEQPAVAQVVSQLTQLSHLEVTVPEGAVAQLPRSLKHLALACPTDSDTHEAEALDLQHLTAWQELTLHSCPSTSIKLPPHVAQLTIMDSERLQRVTGGAQELGVEFGVSGIAGLLTLAALSRLPNITSMKLWWHIPEIFFYSNPPRESIEAAQQAAAALSQASSLTMLEFEYPLPFPAVVAWCQSMAQLSQLRRLSLSNPGLGHDLLHLTRLTLLTLLKVEDHFLRDVVAVSLALHLTGLQALSLCSDSLHTAALLPVMAASLTGLVDLELINEMSIKPFGDSDLMLLSSLTRLTELVLRRSEFTSEGVQRFLSGMPELKEVKPIR